MMKIKVVVDVTYTDNMDKVERAKLEEQGFTILRSQWDQRRGYYKIVKYSRNGGWSRFGGSWFVTAADAIKKIEFLAENYPTQYKKED